MLIEMLINSKTYIGANLNTGYYNFVKNRLIKYYKNIVNVEFWLK